MTPRLARQDAAVSSSTVLAHTGIGTGMDSSAVPLSGSVHLVWDSVLFLITFT